MRAAPVKKQAFRADINGLRGIAVLAVVFHHFDILGFRGGYVGVDIFYVISGFLITQIVAARLATRSFSLAGFYSARARRILPALGAVTAVLLLFGYACIPPVDYKLFGWQALSALTFVSNIVLSHQGDYFDTAAREEWLLHTWTLGVEWQFYMLLPLLLMGLHKWHRRYVKPAVALLFAASFATSVIWTRLEPAAAFYLLPTRAWELLAGALLYLYAGTQPRSPRCGELGLVFILTSIWFYTPALAFPGFWALLPVAGTVLILAAQPHDALLDNRGAQFFGNISYSLYLWHWPVIVAARYFDVPFTPLHVGLLLGVAVGVATLSYTFIENPFRKARRRGRLKLFAYALLPLAAALIYYGDGLPGRVSPDVRAATEQPHDARLPKRGTCGTDYKKRIEVPDCVFGANARPTAVLWGDSHANALYPAVSESLMAAGRAGLLYSNAGCPPVLEAVQPTKRRKNQCKLINRAIFDKTVADKSIRDVILTSRWSLYLLGYNEKGGENPYVVFSDAVAPSESTQPARARAYEQKTVDTLCGLAAAGKRVHVIAPVPEMGRNVPAALAKSRLLYERDADVTLAPADYNQRNAVVRAALSRAAQKCGVHVIEPARALCTETACDGIRDGHALYSDDNHLNVYGNRLLRPLVDRSLAKD